MADDPVVPDDVFVRDGHVIETWADWANPVPDDVACVPVIQYGVGMGLTKSGRPVAFVRVRTPDDPDLESGVMLLFPMELAEGLASQLASQLASAVALEKDRRPDA